MYVQDIFICPECGGLQIEEVMTDVVASSPVASVAKCGELEYAAPTMEGGIVNRYQCVACGHAILDVSNGAELYAFLLSDENKWKHTRENCEQLASYVMAGMPEDHILEALRGYLVEQYLDDEQLAKMIRRRTARDPLQEGEETNHAT